MNESKVIGLMSGTSLDGIDAVLVNMYKDNNGKFIVKYIDMESLPFDKKVLKIIKSVIPPKRGSIKNLAYLNFALGNYFSEAALKLLSKSSLSKDDIDLISCSGLTICNLPKTNDNLKPKARVQIGELAVLAERTGITVVGDFRPGDVAAEGEGAPLIPFFDYHVFKSDKKNRIILNIGGISNITYIKAGSSMDEIVAFDTGPGNMIINNLINLTSKGEKKFDEDGKIASDGIVNNKLREFLLENPFIYLKPPKSAGREEFGEKYLKEINLVAEKLNLNDILATLSNFTAETIYKNCELFLGPVDEIIMSGGGIYNKEIMKYLKSYFKNSKFYLTDDFGVPVKAKEAMGFALLGYAAKYKIHNNVPSATGAKHPVIMGKLVCNS
ncbi:MAG: anhydro-N-acetylmuramic acid kinase [Candidatus Humimicrobiaceae bacterium]